MTSKLRSAAGKEVTVKDINENGEQDNNEQVMIMFDEIMAKFASLETRLAAKV